MVDISLRATHLPAELIISDFVKEDLPYMKNPNLWVRVFVLSSGQPLAVGQVIGSSPISSTKKKSHPNWDGFFVL